MCYKFFADKMYYIVTGYFFILGVVAVTAIFEPIIAPKLKCIFPGLHEDADYQLTFWENKKQQFDLKFNRRSKKYRRHGWNFCTKNIFLMNELHMKIIYDFKFVSIRIFSIIEQKYF